MMAHQKLGLRHVLVQQPQQAVAFNARHAHNVRREARVDEEVLAVSHRVHAHDRVNHGWHVAGIVEQLLCVASCERRVERLAPIGQR